MRFSKSLFTLCIVAALASGSRGALASDPTEASVEAHALTSKAAALYDEGIVAYKKGQWANAHASFLAAWSLKKHWQIAANLADCELELGKAREAAEHAAFYLRNAPADRRARAQALLDRATAKVGTLIVTVDPAGVDVFVDGQPIGKSPLEDPVFVAPGHHMLEAHAGAKFGSAEVDVAAGARKPVTLALKDPAPPVVPASRGPSLPIVISGAAVGAVALATGIALLAVSGTKAGEGDKLLDELHQAKIGCASPPMAGKCSDLLDLRREQGTLHNVGVPFVVAGALVGAATVVYALVPRRKADDTAKGVSWRVLPAAGPGGGGVLISGSF